MSLNDNFRRPTAAGLRGLVLALGAAAAALAVLASCGGGVGSGGTGSFASGPITGFGSVIVGGVRFDDSMAAVADGDGGRRSREELRLGMTVEIDSSAISTDATGSSVSTATARNIRFESELAGLVGAVDVAGSSFTLLGQRVAVDASTVFDDRLDGGLATLRVGQGLEVYAVYDTANARYRATRVEPSVPATGLRLRGPLAQVDLAAQTLRIGSTVYSYAGATAVPSGLAAGQFVRLRLALVALPTVRWVVQSFATALQTLPDADGVKVEGLISAFTSANLFSVGGRPVDASGASFPSGTAGLAAGVRVAVEGTLRAGTVRASKVQIVSDDEVRDRGFELSGAITAVNAQLATIVLRGITVSTARSDLRFESGSAANLVVGATVEARGVLSSDRRTLEATRIKFR